MSPLPGISFVVPVRNGEASLDRVLAAMLAQRDGRDVEIIAVDDGSSPMFIPTAGRMVAWAENALSLIGLKTSVVWQKGDPRRVLIDQAQAWRADSIFVGGRRFSSALERFQLGSVATTLVTKAHCSVEVVRNRAS